MRDYPRHDGEPVRANVCWLESRWRFAVEAATLYSGGRIFGLCALVELGKLPTGDVAIRPYAPIDSYVSAM
jgi:hypothetical protein